MRTVLHVGLPKTGTSSLKAVLRRHDRALRAEAGVVFPVLRDPGGDSVGHNDLAMMLASGRPDVLGRARRIVETARAGTGPGETLLISAEDFSKHVAAPRGESALEGLQEVMHELHHGGPAYRARRMRYLNRLRDVFAGGGDLEIWLCLRRQDDFCVSLYKQAVRNRPYIGRPGDLAGSDLAYFDYLQVYRDWRRLGPVRLFLYEDARAAPGGVPGAYLDALGAALPDGAAAMPRENAGLHPDLLEAMRRINMFPVDRRRTWQRLLDWGAAEDLSPGPEGYDLLTAAERDGLMARHAAGNAELRRLSGVATPGRDTLFPARRGPGRPVYPGLSQERFERICRDLALNPDSVL